MRYANHASKWNKECECEYLSTKPIKAVPIIICIGTFWSSAASASGHFVARTLPHCCLAHTRRVNHLCVMSVKSLTSWKRLFIWLSSNFTFVHIKIIAYHAYQQANYNTTSRSLGVVEIKCKLRKLQSNIHNQNGRSKSKKCTNVVMSRVQCLGCRVRCACLLTFLCSLSGSPALCMRKARELVIHSVAHSRRRSRNWVISVPNKCSSTLNSHFPCQPWPVRCAHSISIP